MKTSMCMFGALLAIALVPHSRRARQRHCLEDALTKSQAPACKNNDCPGYVRSPPVTAHRPRPVMNEPPISATPRPRKMPPTTIAEDRDLPETTRTSRARTVTSYTLRDTVFRCAARLSQQPPRAGWQS